MNNYTPSQLKEHLQWLYRQPNYYKEKKTFTHGGKREKILIYKYHEEWAKENGYRNWWIEKNIINYTIKDLMW